MLTRRSLIAGAVMLPFARVSFAETPLQPVPGVTAPPVEVGDFKPTRLVELIKLDPTFKLDIRYATANNFVGRQMYSQARAFLQLPVAKALIRAHRRAKKLGYGFTIFDGYRPWSVTKYFWDVTPADKRSFVANPAKGSKHNRGCAVDLTLHDLKTGQQVEMPSPYDDFTEKADPDYTGGTAEQRRLRDLLRHVMEKEGFTVDGGEWWHFDYKDWRKYRINNVPFEQL